MKYAYNIFSLTCAFLQPSQAITLEVMKANLTSENWATPQLVMLNNKGLSMLLAKLLNKYTL